MKQLLIIALAAVTTFALQTSLAAQSSATRTVNPAFAGSWEGRMNDLPGIELKVHEAQGKFSGVMVFHLQERDTPDGRWHRAAEDRAALLTPRIEGDAFNFEVQHHKCHDCDELGSNVKLRMELSGTNEARLWKLGDEGKPSGKELQLERRSDSLAFAGAWEGKRDNRAGLDLKIEDADGKISGTTLLYFQVGPALPLISPRAEGNMLMFEIQRRKCTQCDEPGANSKFLVQLTGPNEASLWMWTDGEIDTHRAPDVKLVRHADSASWHDRSAHHVQFVVLEYGVRIEVLDWGGTGRNVVLLAGSGNTGHVFDDFAEKLNSFCHLYAITRRGYGESSHPDAGWAGVSGCGF